VEELIGIWLLFWFVCVLFAVVAMVGHWISEVYHLVTKNWPRT